VTSSSRNNRSDSALAAIGVEEMGEPGPDTKRPIVMLAYDFPPENASGAQRPFRFSKYLRYLGHKVHVVTASRQNELAGDGVSYARPSPEKGETYFKRSRSLAWMQRVLPYNDSLPWIPQAVGRSEEFVKSNEGTVVISTSPPVAAHIAAAVLKCRNDIRWIADFRDPLRDNPFRTRLSGRPYDTAVERLVVSYADAIIVNTNVVVEALRKRYPNAASKVHVIWNGYDPEEALGPAAIEDRPHKILLHAGAIYGGRHPGALLASLVRLMTRGVLRQSDIRLKLVGLIDAEEEWVAESNFFNLVKQGWLEYSGGVVPKEEAQKDIAGADFLLLLDMNKKGVGIQVPAKLFEYVRIGRPILAFTARNSPSEWILRNCGIPHSCVYPDDVPGDVDKKLLTFLRHSSEPVRPSQWFQDNFTAVEQAKYLDRVISLL